MVADATIIGTSGSDTLTGTSGNDSINGGAGNDTITSGAGNDTINGGLGNDSVNAGTGNDTIFGNAGNDSLLGSEGDDKISGGNGNDTIKGGAGNDLINGDEGDDALFGGQGSDSLHGGVGSDYLSGGSDSDFLDGGTGKDRLEGGTGNDTYFFQKGDSLTGDTIQEVADSTDLGNKDTVRFGNSIALGDVVFFRSGNDLQIGYRGTTDVITVKGQFGGTAVEEVRLNDGSYVSAQDINLILQQTATYAANNGIAYTSINSVKNSDALAAIATNTFHH